MPGPIPRNAVVKYFGTPNQTEGGVNEPRQREEHGLQFNEKWTYRWPPGDPAGAVERVIYWHRYDYVGSVIRTATDGPWLEDRHLHEVLTSRTSAAPGQTESYVVKEADRGPAMVCSGVVMDAPKKSVGEDLQWWENRYVTLTAKVGDVARQLTFAGIACIWIFKQGVPNVVLLPQPLILAALLFVSALGADLLHGLLTVLDADLWVRHLERNELSSTPGRTINLVIEAGRLLFWIKIGFTVAGYGPLLLYLVRVLKVS